MAPANPLSREFPKRLQRLARETRRRRLDALIVMTPINRLYLTGFSSTAGMVIVFPDSEPEFLTDFRYFEMARKAIDGARVRMTGNLNQWLATTARRRKIRRIGFEGTLSANHVSGFRNAMPDVKEWAESGNLIVKQRAVKSRAEQAAIRSAVRLGDEVYERTIAEVRPGMTEWDVRRVLRGWVDRLDAESESFDCIVSAGSNASKPHAKVTQRVLRKGQPLLIDMGVRLNSYCSDLTRVAFLGTPSARLKKVYGIVLTAHLKAIDAIRAGKTGQEIDAVARKYIERRGYGKCFGHGLGHGVGLEVHESPGLARGNTQPLRSGMVVTVEPGIYLPGVGGVRIEDMVIVRRDGCEILTRSPKDLTIL